MGKRPPKWLPGERVNETILTQRKSVEELRADRLLRKPKLKDQRSRMKAKIDMKRKKKLNTKRFLSAQTILNQALKRDKEARKFNKAGEKVLSRQRRQKKEHAVKQYKNANVCLVIRARGNIVPKDVERAFLQLGLEKIYKGRLVVQNATTERLLTQLRPFSIMGFPSSQQLEQLIRTRGCFWNSETKSKAYISGNLQVEQRLGQFNILSIEELVDAIKTKSEHVTEVLKTLAPFDLHPPRKLYIERHRNARQKLEILNPDSFAKYIQDELFGEQKAAAATKRKARIEARKKSSGASKVEAAVTHAVGKAEAEAAESASPAKKVVVAEKKKAGIVASPASAKKEPAASPKKRVRPSA